MTSGFGLLFVDELHENSLVLEDVTLGLQVKFVVHVTVNLLGLSVRLEHTSEDSESTQPDGLGWHTSVGSTLSFTKSHVSALLSFGVPLVGTGSGMHDGGLLDDQTVLDQLSDVLP